MGLGGVHGPKLGTALGISSPPGQAGAGPMEPRASSSAAKRRQRVRHGADELADVEQGADLGRALPVELAKLCHRVLRLDFLRALVEHRPREVGGPAGHEVVFVRNTTEAVNVLAAARIFMFASRDVWFVVGVPVFLFLLSRQSR